MGLSRTRKSEEPPGLKGAASSDLLPDVIVNKSRKLDETRYLNQARVLRQGSGVARGNIATTSLASQRLLADSRPQPPCQSCSHASRPLGGGHRVDSPSPSGGRVAIDKSPSPDQASIAFLPNAVRCCRGLLRWVTLTTHHPPAPNQFYINKAGKHFPRVLKPCARAEADFLGAGLLEYGLEVRLRGLQSIMVWSQGAVWIGGENSRGPALSSNLIGEDIDHQPQDGSHVEERDDSMKERDPPHRSTVHRHIRGLIAHGDRERVLPWHRRSTYSP